MVHSFQMLSVKKCQSFVCHVLRIFVPVSFLFGFLLFITFQSEKESDLRLLSAEEKNVVHRKADAMANLIRYISTDLLVVSNLHELQDYLREDSFDSSDLENDLLFFSKIKGQYDQIRYINRFGNERVRINFNEGDPEVSPPEKLQNKAQRYYFRQSLLLDKAEVYVSPLDLNVENGEIEIPYKPVLRIATPIFSERGQKTGILVFNYLADKLLNVMDNMDITTRGDFSVLNPEGYWLQATNSDDEWGFMFAEKSDITFPARHPEVWNEIKVSASGQFQTDKGLFTFHKLYPGRVIRQNLRLGNMEFPAVADLNIDVENYLVLLSHIPQTKLQQMTFYHGYALLGLYAFILVCTFVGAWVFARFRIQRLALENNREKLIKDLQMALHEVKTLQGILPICSYCKNIRNDEGYYEKLEGYFSKNSSVDFSHTICPDCLKEKFPDIYEVMKKENKI